MARTSGTDTAIGTDGDDLIRLGGKDDTVFGGPGNDRIEGGGGTDTAVYAGRRTDYAVTVSTDGARTVSVAGADGADDLVAVERLQFNDGILVVDVENDVASQAYRLYRAALGRDPDAAGLAFHTDNLEAGWGLADVATGFLDSPEFATRFGTPGDRAYVEQLYRNVLGREAAAAEVDYYAARLAGGHTRQDILVSFSESPENRANVASQIGTGIWLGTGDGTDPQPRTVTGTPADETLAGGAGDDILTGNGGNDRFVVDVFAGTDRITDFARGDTIQVTVTPPDGLMFPAAIQDPALRVSVADGVTTLTIAPSHPYLVGAVQVELVGTFAADDFRFDGSVVSLA